MKQTSQRSLLFRQNVNRTEAEWVHFLDGYRKALIEFDMKKFGRECGARPRSELHFCHDFVAFCEDICRELFVGADDTKSAGGLSPLPL